RRWRDRWYTRWFPIRRMASIGSSPASSAGSPLLNPRSRKSALGEIQESRLGERGGVCGCWSCYAELVGTMWAGFGREREGKMDCTSFRQGKMSSFLIMCMQHV
ncbi:unnamed protein product, partial [Musa banksii]